VTALRVALVHHGRRTSAANELAATLQERGHDAAVIASRPTALDALLGRRGFATPIAHLPATLRELATGHYDIAHAFTPHDAYAALLWGRRSGCPVVFSCVEPIQRERLAERRLSLRLLRAALDKSDALIVHDDEARDAAWRWLALELPVIPLGDGAEHERLYRRLLAQT
jgi:hypothetical protein